MKQNVKNNKVKNISLNNSLNNRNASFRNF